jgi:hypothetical protein
MSPRRFQVSPLREIWSSRDTLPSTIHCWSVGSTSKVNTSPLVRRIIQGRGGGALDAGSAGCSATGSVSTTCRVRTLKT